ncbi:acyltransferase family protein [Colwellia sp. TT2012]|uniref:acyltransferase family protein n=1 Tax=Colwellia sp. TT2012 TaxID=1720342 RepID=UPI00070DAFD9|nr:acyltransferase [Colwellia sp. TT2012]
MNNRLGYLDSIRGLAALLVVVHHTFEVFLKYNEGAYPILSGFNSTVDLGRLGVIVFFITSGFVIPWSLKGETPNALKNFAIKRFFRLYPAYWFSIIVATIIGLGVGVHVDSPQQVLVNFTMIHKFLGVESVIGAYWTLHLELVFYIACAGLFYFGGLKNNKYLITLSVLLSLAAIVFASIRYYYHIKIPIIMPLGLSAMFYGAVLRNYLLEKQTELKIPLIILTIFYFASLFVAQRMYYLDGWLSWYVTQLSAFTVFYLLVTKIKLNNPFFIYLGKVSYSLYLLHAVVIGAVFHLFGDFAFTSLGFALVFLTVLIVSIIVAELSCRFVEKPGVTLARKFTAKYKKETITNRVSDGI